jgi:hypothetical protein
MTNLPGEHRPSDTDRRWATAQHAVKSTGEIFAADPLSMREIRQ